MANVIMVVIVIVVVTVTLLAFVGLHSDVRTSLTARRPLGRSQPRHDSAARCTAQASEAVSTTPAQVAADSAEDDMIRRYREGHTPVRHGLIVSCGLCGTSQIVRPHRGTHRFALVCCSCHVKTLITLPAAR
jgi:hypothetical protein